MPDAIIVTDEYIQRPEILLYALEKRRLVKRVKVKGVNVWGRYYMEDKDIKKAYLKEIGNYL